MNEISLSSALRKQFHDPNAYFEQFGNVFLGLFRALTWWVVITTAYASGAAIFAFVTWDLSVYPQSSLQEFLHTVVWLAGFAAALACILSNMGKFRNVFSARAMDEVERFRSIKERVESQTDITEGLLVEHGLITEADVKRRRAEVERRTATISGTSLIR